jgi:hypothetical protein
VSVNVISYGRSSEGQSSDINSIGQILPLTCFKVVKDCLQPYLNSSRSNLKPFVQPLGLEIGLSIEEIYIRLNKDTAFGQIIEAGAGNVEIVPVAMIDALSEIPNVCELDVEHLVSDWLGQ